MNKGYIRVFINILWILILLLNVYVVWILIPYIQMILDGESIEKVYGVGLIVILDLVLVIGMMIFQAMYSRRISKSNSSNNNVVSKEESGAYKIFQGKKYTEDEWAAFEKREFETFKTKK